MEAFSIPVRVTINTTLKWLKTAVWEFFIFLIYHFGLYLVLMQAAIHKQPVFSFNEYKHYTSHEFSLLYL